MLEKLKWALETITMNANSVSDNPLWVPEEQAMEGEEAWQWVSGGNFFSMHMVEVLDTLRKICTQIIKRNDRHLAKLIDPVENNDLAPNLSDPVESISQCAFKGIQILSGMLEVYSMSLANPVSILFGIHEERNQDLTPHATTSGNLALKSLELLKYSLAGNLLAIAQAVDLRGGGHLLSPRTQPLYEAIRRYSPKVTQERPLHEDIERIAQALENESMMEVIREQIFVELDEHPFERPLQQPAARIVTDRL
jgi:histidine ammonia-lyase